MADHMRDRVVGGEGVASLALELTSGKADMCRSVTITVLGTLVTAALAIAINVATGGSRHLVWSWAAVAVLIVAAGAVSWLERRTDSDARPTHSSLSSPAELPGDIADFTGRAEAVDQVRTLVTNTTNGQSHAVVISAMTGMAGIGKTALAVHVAHLALDRFPDGQFYVNLRGAEAQPLDPRAVLGDFLGQFGMLELPDELDSRARAYRSRMAGRRILVVLDNAADEDQVRPLLPGSPSCAVLITSRSRLVNLVGARLVELDVLPVDEAVGLLRQLVGSNRVAVELEPAREIVRRCGCLPIAIRIAGAALVARPQLALARFAEQLRAERPLDVLSAAGSDDVRTSFSLSYRNLAAAEQRLFRLLGLLRSPDFPAWVGEVALGIPTERGSRAVIDRLVEAQLLEDDRGQEDAAGQHRYRFHDLLREFAREQVDGDDHHAALDRVLTRYAVISEAASGLLQPVDQHHPSTVDEPSFCNGAMAWYTAEHESLVTAVEQAGAVEFSGLACRLALSLEAFFERGAHWDSWQHTGELALDAARAAGDQDSESRVLRSLGYLARERGNPRQALELLEDSLRGFRELSDQFGQSRALCNMIRTYRDLGRFRDAQDCYRSALPIARSCGSRWLEANIQRDMGMAHRDQGEADEAVACLEAAFPLFRETGDEWLATYTVRDIGMVQQRQGRQSESALRFEEALAGFERLGDRRGVARALNSLGNSYREQGHWPEAADCFERALDVFRQIGDRRWEAYTLRSLGELHGEQAAVVRGRRRKQTQWRTAEEHLHASREILADLGDRLWEARTILSLGKVYLRQGLWNAAIACVDECFVTFREMDNVAGQAEAQSLLEQAVAGRNR
jgi:tetratricopeptide (TPR) repeat protein